jgi:hypothetical protein
MDDGVLVVDAVTSGGDRASVLGDLVEPGSELSIGDEFFVQFEKYDGTEFLPIAGPTVLRLLDISDVEAFERDAIAARCGDFLPVLLHPMIHLADQCGLGTAPCGGPKVRRYVDVHGGQRVTAAGPLVNSTERACDTTCVPPTLAKPINELRRAHPWLPRYLAALDVLRAIGMRYSIPWRVSGFGTRLNSELSHSFDLGAQGYGLPFLLLGSDRVVVYDQSSRALASIGRDAARFAEVLLATGGHAAALVAAELLDLPIGAAASACSNLVERLGQVGVSLPPISEEP